jgi:hypothetical protein
MSTDIDIIVISQVTVAAALQLCSISKSFVTCSICGSYAGIHLPIVSAD